MSRALTRDAEAAFRQAAADREIAVVVFTGAGRAFCAGDDLKEFDQQTASPAAIRPNSVRTPVSTTTPTAVPA